ncbi:MAG: hypothetical protein ABJG78_09765 [Cyclobacteriaceae bacterium]
MNKRIFFLVSVVLAIISLSTNTLKAQGDFVVIVNKDVTESSLSSAAIRRIYFGFNASWDSSQRIKVSYTDFSSPEFWEFLSTNKTSYSQFWTKRERSGNGNLPVALQNSESIIDYVSSTKGAIGIIHSDLAGTIGDDCKLVAISD